MVAFDVAPSGRVAVLAGRRLSVEGGAAPLAIDLAFAGRRCRFRGEEIVVLGAASELASIAEDGTVRGTARVRTDARDVAVLPSGSVLVSYGPAAGVTLERFGDQPCVFKDAALLDATCLAAESGGVWVLGTAAEAPLSRAVRLRPVPEGFRVRDVVALPAPPRAAAVGPDNALYVLVEPGTAVVRVDAGQASEPGRLAGPLRGLARHGRRLLGRGDAGVEDLTRLVPVAPPRGAPPPLPPCGPSDPCEP
ncbi:MAG TPA: hypothetical protein VFY93_18130 [Planctomycetota bacterium]|nr:hypothetical protein [Planctomycetota bacterium]